MTKLLNNLEFQYALQTAQAEKAFGELRALVAMNYSLSGSNTQYKEMNNMVETFIKEFEDKFC